mmetsp:Transcript_19224/g.21798  ORF Transcript_19224/g.21798 Transcript_19224/m.21798 type:complete len:92 (-) Transcript_19224:62-337(-)
MTKLIVSRSFRSTIILNQQRNFSCPIRKKRFSHLLNTNLNSGLLEMSYPAKNDSSSLSKSENFNFDPSKHSIVSIAEFYVGGLKPRFYSYQ